MKLFYAVNEDTNELFGYDIEITGTSCDCCSDDVEFNYTSIYPEVPVAMFKSVDELESSLARHNNYLIRKVEL